MWLCHINLYIGLVVLGVVFGLGATITYGIQYHNYSGMSVAFLSAISACALLHLLWAYKKNWIQDWSPLQFDLRIKIGTTFAILGLVAMTCCFITAGLDGTTLHLAALHGENLWMTSIWCYAFFKWNFSLAMFSSKCAEKVYKESGIVTAAAKGDEDVESGTRDSF